MASEDQNTADNGAPPLRAPSRRHVTRIAVVQTLYQADLTGKTLQVAAKEMRKHYLGRAVDGETPVAADPKFFDTVISAVSDNGPTLIEMLQSSLKNRPLERMELVLQAILLAGAAELYAVHEAPPKVIITEYVEIAEHFFGRPEASVVNAALDKIGHLVRPGEF
jgi:N utilization substance protein B